MYHPRLGLYIYRFLSSLPFLCSPVILFLPFWPNGFSLNTKLAFLRLLMGHVIDTTEVQRTKAASNHHIEPSTQDNTGSSVLSQLSNDYSSLPSNTPGPCLSCRQGHPSSPVDVQKFANPAPLGLCAFALTCFISSCISLNVRGVQAAGVSVSLALNYGGIAQVLAGMWYVSIHPIY